MEVLRKEIVSLLVLLIVSIFAQSVEADQTTSFLVNCGTNSSVDIDGRRWIGDASSHRNFNLSSPGFEASTNVFNGDPTYAPLYKTARVFTDALNYTLRVPRGNYFLRLHYHPFSFSRYEGNDSWCSVSANDVRLVSDFNAPVEILNLNRGKDCNSSSCVSYLMKEYLCVDASEEVVVSFLPSKGSFGFVNAVELVPEGNVDYGCRGFETMYRLNVGGLLVRPSQDPLFWRSWESDSSYMINSDAGSETKNASEIVYSDADTEAPQAPIVVYETARALSNAGVMEKRFNMSWKLEVDPGFEYLIRLHFCEFVFEEANQRIFRIFINNKTVADHFDIYVRSGGTNRAYHEDYVDYISLESKHVWIQLGPETTTSSSGGTDALLNGLEVFKISKNNDLAYVEKYANHEVKRRSGLVLWIGIGAVFACIAFLAAVYLRFFNKHDEKSVPIPNIHADSSSYRNLNRQFGRRFSLIEIREAANDFDERLVIGEGGFGKVYKGVLNYGVLVAIKRSDPESQQGLSEFETEIEMLSKVRHRHLVSLIGFCDESGEMILVYEFMANGTLRSHLFGCDLPILSWKQRLEICIGAARGLHYLHTGLDRSIIHRDVKTSNILLDHHLFAKMSDFGISKIGPELDHTHVSTAVKGSFGYLDPEYFRMQHLTEKSDVYSFGVVLFEALSARAVIDPALPKDEINLAEWALRMQREKSIVSIVDARIRRRCDRESVIRFGEIAEKCVADEGKKRPTMGEVLWQLGNVLQIHEAWLCRENPISIDDEIGVVERPENSLQEDGDNRNEDPFNPMVVGIDDFSQMIKLQGR